MRANSWPDSLPPPRRPSPWPSLAVILGCGLLVYVLGWFAGWVSHEVYSPSSSASQARIIRPTSLTEFAHPLETAVRIRTNGGIGSGTVIDGRADRALILTCAHLFRGTGGAYPTPKDYRGSIRLELFKVRDGQAEPLETLDAEMVDFDAIRDVGLLKCRPGRALRSSPLVETGYKPNRGDSLASVGCSLGAIPTAIAHKIRGEINSGGYSAVVVEPKPTPGRSGGGLFTLDRKLVGVCNFAEVQGTAGFYASPGSVRFVLQRNGLDPLAQPDADAESDELDVIPGQSAQRPPRKAEPPAALPSPQELNPPAVLPWVERVLGVTPSQVSLGALAFAVWSWLQRRRAPSTVQAAPAPAPASGKPTADDLFGRGLELLSTAIRTEAAETDRAKRDQEQAAFRARLVDQLRAHLSPTSGPTGSAPLPAS